MSRSTGRRQARTAGGQPRRLRMHHNVSMFFRRERPRTPTFSDRLAQASAAGFQVQKEGGNRALVSRKGCVALVDETPRLERAGVLVNGRMAVLVDGGFQKFWQTPDGKKLPALAAQLEALHSFEEDLRDALGAEGLYNEALGTVNDLHDYDRLRR